MHLPRVFILNRVGCSRRERMLSEIDFLFVSRTIITRLCLVSKSTSDLTSKSPSHHAVRVCVCLSLSPSPSLSFLILGHSCIAHLYAYLPCSHRHTLCTSLPLPPCTLCHHCVCICIRTLCVCVCIDNKGCADEFGQS